VKSDLCKMFGIEFPIFAFSHCRDVAAAVSRAGGFGVLGALGFDAEQLELELRWMDEHVNGRPYGVDVVLPVVSADRRNGLGGTGDMAAELRDLIGPEHWQYATRILKENGVDAEVQPDPAMKVGLGFTEAGSTPQIEVALAHPITLLVSALGPPSADVIDQAHAQGVRVGALVGRVDQAVRGVQKGLDVIVAQSYEAGGHTGDIGGMVLIPDVVDAVSPIPVLAAGGIGSGRQMAAAMTLGAAGVWTGSVWLTTTESNTDPAIIERLLAAKATDTVRSKAMTGKPARQLRTAWTDAWDSPSSPGPLTTPLQLILHTTAMRHVPESAAPRLRGFPVGQVVGRMDRVKSSKQVVLEMVEEFIEATERQHNGLDL
jgi:NAD(P)H-dependent flavin oxidoreductase YrpB (nitropropane dioxygenase family)